MVILVTGVGDVNGAGLGQVTVPTDHVPSTPACRLWQGMEANMSTTKERQRPTGREPTDVGKLRDWQPPLLFDHSLDASHSVQPGVRRQRIADGQYDPVPRGDVAEKPL